MAALDFPASPTLNQTYTANGSTWRWDGSAWVASNIVAISGGGTGQITASAAANALDGYLAIATTGGTTTLTATTARTIVLTGTLAHTIQLPDVTTLQLGWQYNIVNLSTQAVTVNSSGGNAFSQTITAGMVARLVCIAVTGTTAASWSLGFLGSTTRTGFGNIVYHNSPALVTPNLGTPSAATLTNATGLPLTTGVTGTLPIANGGTNATSAGAAATNLQGFTTTATTGLTTSLTNTSSLYQLFTGTGTAITLPITSTLALGWSFHIVNNTSATLSVSTALGDTVINIPIGTTAMVTCISTTLNNLSAWEAGLTDFTTYTGTGGVVLENSPTLITPNLGTPSAATLTNATNLPIVAGTTGTLTVARGGTGLATLPANNVLLGNGTGNLLSVAPGANGNVLQSNGTTWTSAAAPSGMVYPGAGIPNSTGTAWGTSYAVTGTGNVMLNNNPTVTNYTETAASSSGAGFTVNLANGTVFIHTMTGSGTITLPASVAGKSFVIIVLYNGAFTITWGGGSTLLWPGGVAPAQSSVSGARDIFTFIQDGTRTFGSIAGQDY